MILFIALYIMIAYAVAAIIATICHIPLLLFGDGMLGGIICLIIIASLPIGCFYKAHKELKEEEERKRLEEEERKKYQRKYQRFFE